MLGVVHKLHLQEEGVGGQKKSNFRKLLYHTKCKRRGVGGQKMTNLVNVVCERPLISEIRINFIVVLGVHEGSHVHLYVWR